MDNYNEFIKLLKSFNRENKIGENEDEHSPSILYNGFSCENLDDISAYRMHLENQCSKAISDIKKGVDKLMLERDSTHMLDIFFKGKLDDFKELEEIICKRDKDSQKEHRKYSLIVACRENKGIILDDEGVQMFRAFWSTLVGAEEYYRGIIDKNKLAKYCMNESEMLRSSAFFFFILAEKEQRDMVKKAKQKLEELHHLYCPPNKEKDSKVEKVPTTKQEKDFRSYLHHENKDALIEKLHELLDGHRGKVVAITIKALEQLGFMLVADSRRTLYKAMREEFGEIGSDQSINPIMYKFKEYSNEIEQQMKILKEVK